MSNKDRNTPVPEPLRLENIFDAHTHLNAIASGGVNYQTFSANDLQIIDITTRAHKVGVTRMVTVADDLVSAIFAAEAAAILPGVYGAVALHPMHAHQLNDTIREQLTTLAQEPRIVAIGETGLDWYWAGKDHSAERPQQEASFRWHIDLAKQTHKALMIHNREADADILRILAAEKAPDTVIFHCFSSDADMAKKCVKQGFYLSISGTVTFKNSQSLQEAVKIIPPELLLVETDAPFLTPHPYRGRPNEPYCLPYTVRFLADLLEIMPQDLADITNANAVKAFGLSE